MFFYCAYCITIPFFLPRETKPIPPYPPPVWTPKCRTSRGANLAFAIRLAARSSLPPAASPSHFRLWQRHTRPKEPSPGGGGRWVTQKCCREWQDGCYGCWFLLGKIRVSWSLAVVVFLKHHWTFLVFIYLEIVWDFFEHDCGLFKVGVFFILFVSV